MSLDTETSVRPYNRFLAQSVRSAVVAIGAVSAAAVVFLLWLVYGRTAPAEFAHRLTFLPALNAVFNGLSALALAVGFVFILRRQITAHRNAMLTAFFFSSLFLVSYITNHALHGDTRYPIGGAHRTLYLSMLASHVILSVVALPLVFLTFSLSLSGRFELHKKVARWTFPIWFYVSVTGVLVYLMLHAAFGDTSSFRTGIADAGRKPGRVGSPSQS